MLMNKRLFGGALGKYLLAILLVCLLVGFFWWKENYGVFGQLAHLTGSTAGDIVFVREGKSGSTNLFLIHDDGTNLRRLTNDPSLKRNPTWNPTGNEIAYAGESSVGGTHTLQIYLLGSGTPQQATQGSIQKDNPTWIMNGQKVAFLTGGVIKVINPNGTGLKQVYPPPIRGGAESTTTNDNEEADFLLPPIRAYAWDPNGKQIAGIQTTDGQFAPAMGESNWWKTKSSGGAQQNIQYPESAVLLPSMTSKPALIPGGASNHVGIAWLPDGKRLVVALSGAGDMNSLIIHRTDDLLLPMQPLLLAKPYTVAPENPCVSSDGTKVAFELWRMSSPDDRQLLGIAVLPTDLPNPIVIKSLKDVGKIPLVLKGEMSDPKWSPDGSKLLYTMVGAGGRDIWVCNADGSDRINLTKGNGDNVQAEWSPILK